VASVEVLAVGFGVLEGDMSVHQITPSFVSMQEVVTNFVLGRMISEVADVITVVTMLLVTVTVLRMTLEFHSPEEPELAEPVDDGMLVLRKGEVVGRKLRSEVLLGAGGEYGGGAE